MPLHFEAVKSELGYAETRRMNELLVSSLRRARLPSVVRIPVVVHVVAAMPEQEVTDEQIHEQIAILTEGFRARNADIGAVPEAFKALVADVGIEFALATRDPAGRPTNGIVRKRTNIQQFPQASAPPDQLTTYIARELMLGETGSVAWPAESYLNVWVCNMGRNPLGFAAFPGSPTWRDGIVVDYRCFGASGTAEAPFDLGRTAVHEVGHWLDLLHIWGDDNGQCIQSDNVSDTPNQAGPNDGKPSYPSITCNNAPHGDLFMNYMDYVDDAVMCMFTQNQVARMHAALQGRRAGLLVSKGLDNPNAEAGTQYKRLLELNAFNRAGRPEEQYFDGVGWITVGRGDGA
jgi:hypothetical protein